MREVCITTLWYIFRQLYLKDTRIIDKYMPKTAELKDKRIMQVEKEISPIVEKAESITIKDEKSMKEATELLSVVNQRLDAIEAEKKTITDPANAILKRERARWKPTETMLESAVSILRKNITAYQTIAKRKADEAAAKITEKVQAGKISAPTAIRKMGEIDGPAEKVKSDSGSIAFRTEHKFEVLDHTKLPWAYLVPDESAIRTAMKDGLKLPGVRYYTEEVPVNRR